MKRDLYLDSMDRTPGEYARFAVAFFGFMVASAGIVLSSPTLALFGGVIFVFAIYSFVKDDSFMDLEFLEGDKIC